MAFGSSQLLRKFEKQGRINKKKWVYWSINSSGYRNIYKAEKKLDHRGSTKTYGLLTFTEFAASTVHVYVFIALKSGRFLAHTRNYLKTRGPK